MRWLGPPFALLALAALAMPGAAEPDAASPRGDLRLERRITRVIDGRPLAEVIPSIGKELGVALSATMSAADHRVVLCVRDRPAGQLLEELAEHLELEWRRSDTGYALTEAPAVRRKHEEARKARASAEWREARTWVGRAARLASLPAAQLLSTERELSDRLNSADLPPAERAQVADELALVQEARRPATPLAVSILQSLTAAQVARLQSGGDLLLGDGELTPALLAQVRAVRNPETPFADATEFPVWADVLIQFRDWNGQEGPPRPGDRSRQLSITLVGRREREGKQEWTPLGWQPKLPDPASARPLATQTDDPALLRVVELKVPERKRPTLERLGGVETAATWESRLWPAWPTLGDVARQLSEVSGLEVMADGFVRSRVDPRWLEGRRSVAAILDRVATGLDYDWSKQGNLIRLHSRQRVQDRDRDAPERILQPWRERVAHREVASLDDLAELAARLTDEQARGVSDYWGWYFDQHWVSPPTGGAIMFYAQRRHLRFWAALSSAQRQAARSGEVVPVDQLSAAQARAFAEALVEPVLSPWGSGAEFRRKHPAVGLAGVQGGGFSLKQEDAWRQQLYVGTRADGSQMRLIARRPSYRPANLGNLPAEFQWAAVGREFPIDTYRFNYHLAGTAKPARTVELEVTRPAAG